MSYNQAFVDTPIMTYGLIGLTTLVLAYVTIADDSSSSAEADAVAPAVASPISSPIQNVPSPIETIAESASAPMANVAESMSSIAENALSLPEQLTPNQEEELQQPMNPNPVQATSGGKRNKTPRKNHKKKHTRKNA